MDMLSDHILDYVPGLARSRRAQNDRPAETVKIDPAIAHFVLILISRGKVYVTLALQQPFLLREGFVKPVENVLRRPPPHDPAEINPTPEDKQIAAYTKHAITQNIREQQDAAKIQCQPRAD